MGKAGEKDTVIGGHVRCRSGVEHPWVGALKSHLVQGGDENHLVPATWCRVAGGRRCRGRDLRRHEGSVCLGKRRHGRAPLLLWAPSPRVEANPWASGLDFEVCSSLGTLAWLLLQLFATTIACRHRPCPCHRRGAEKRARTTSGRVRRCKPHLWRQ